MIHNSLGSFACRTRRPEVRSSWLPIIPNKGRKVNELTVVAKTAEWQRLKTLVLDSVSSPITKRVYNMALDEFFRWYGHEPRAGFTKATVSAWRVSLEERGLGSSSIIIRMSAIRKLAVLEFLFAPEPPGDRDVFFRTASWLTSGPRRPLSRRARAPAATR